MYSVKIENNTENFITQVDVFGGYKYILKEFKNDGSYIIQDGVRIYCDDMPYHDLLFNSIANPLRIESFEFISDNSKQLSSLITLHRSDANGNIFTRNNIPRPTQEESKSVINEHFLIDGYTKISILKIHPNTTLTIQLIERKKSRQFFSEFFKQIKRQIFGW
jgi:hypothetical protein